MSLINDIEQRTKELEEQRLKEIDRLEKQLKELHQAAKQCQMPADKPVQFDLSTQIVESERQLKKWQENKPLTDFLLQASPFLRQYIEQEQQLETKQRHRHHHQQDQNRGTLYHKFRMVTQGFSLFAYANQVLSGAIQSDNATSTLSLLRQQQTSTELYRGAGMCPNEHCPKRGMLQTRPEEGREVCEECGASMEFVETSGNSMYGTEIDYNSGIQVIDKSTTLDLHFTEFIEKLQGVTCGIPMSVYQKIYDDMKGTKVQQITSARVLDAMMRLKLGKWRDRVKGFVMLLRGERPDYFTSSHIDCMTHMWKQLRPIYEAEKESKKRSNLLCQMVTYKFVQMLQLDARWLHFLPAPSSSHRSREFEQTWYKICTQLNWKQF